MGFHLSTKSQVRNRTQKSKPALVLYLLCKNEMNWKLFAKIDIVLVCWFSALFPTEFFLIFKSISMVFWNGFFDVCVWLSGFVLFCLLDIRWWRIWYDFLQVLGVVSGVLVLLSSVAECRGERILKPFDYPAINCRKHSALLTEFGGIGDGKTSNTKAFKTAIDHLKQFATDGGAELIVPPGKWLTGSFNLTSHFTLYIHKDAVILGSQVWFSPLFSFLLWQTEWYGGWLSWHIQKNLFSAFKNQNQNGKL